MSQVENVPTIYKPKVSYNLNEAAAVTGYSTSTLRIAIRRHDLIARYANRKPVILGEELLDWLRSLPTEPKGGHQPLSYLDRDVEGWPGQPEEPQPMPQRPPKASFRTPEEVAAELGMSKSTLRSYCKVSGIRTRLGRNRIMLHEEDIPRLVSWIRENQDKKDEWWEQRERDPFASAQTIEDAP